MTNEENIQPDGLICTFLRVILSLSSLLRIVFLLTSFSFLCARVKQNVHIPTPQIVFSRSCDVFLCVNKQNQSLTIAIEINAFTCII